MFGGEAILHMDHYVICPVGDIAAIFIIISECGKHKATAAKVQQNWTGLLFLRGKLVDVDIDRFDQHLEKVSKLLHRALD